MLLSGLPDFEPYRIASLTNVQINSSFLLFICNSTDYSISV